MNSGDAEKLVWRKWPASQFICLWWLYDYRNKIQKFQIRCLQIRYFVFIVIKSSETHLLWRSEHFTHTDFSASPEFTYPRIHQRQTDWCHVTRTDFLWPVLTRTVQCFWFSLAHRSFCFLPNQKIRLQNIFRTFLKPKIAISENRKIAYNCIYIVNFRKLRIFGFSIFRKITI